MSDTLPIVPTLFTALAFIWYLPDFSITTFPAELASFQLMPLSKLYWYFAIPLGLVLPLKVNSSDSLITLPVVVVELIFGAFGISLSSLNPSLLANLFAPAVSVAYTHKYHVPLPVFLVIVWLLLKLCENSPVVTPSSFWLHKYFNPSFSIPTTDSTFTDVLCTLAHVSLPFGLNVTVGPSLSTVTT